jgi:radical SAM protein with 4Fe4S-binding SPASM domain
VHERDAVPSGLRAVAVLSVSGVLAGRHRGGGLPAGRDAVHRLDTVVWRVTRCCNLHCLSCHASPMTCPDPAELTTDEGVALVEDLGRLGVRSLVLGGGEPLLRPDVYVLIRTARECGMEVTVVTNGTLIDAAVARELADAGARRVEVDLDRLGPLEDAPLARGLRGPLDFAVRGLRAARAAGLAVGLGLTLTRRTLPGLDRALDLMETERVDRARLGHLVRVGRNGRLSPQALTPEQTRRALERVFERAEAWRRRGLPIELVTDGNDADGAALYLRLRAREGRAAARAWRWLAARGGNASGVHLAAVDACGDVHPDPDWAHASLGNVRARSFSRIWTDADGTVLAPLRDRRPHLHERCRACRYLALCNGGVRVRAEALTGDLWAPDPGCHLTRSERTRGPVEADAVPAAAGSAA